MEMNIEGERTGEIRILMLEDNPDDVELASMILGKSRVCFTMKVIATKEELLAETLSDYDLVLCDYKLKNYDGLRSVKHIRKHTDIPIIITTGSIDEEMGFALLEAGADEFLKKSCLKQLPFFVDKTMKNYEVKTRAKQCERKDEETSQMFDTLFEGLENPVFIKNIDGQYERVNAAFCKLYERSEGEILGKTDLEIRWVNTNDRSYRDDQYILKKGVSSSYEMSFVDEAGKKIWLEVAKNPIFIGGQITGILGQARDVTKRKNAIATMEKSMHVLYQAEELTQAGSFEYDVELDMVTCSKNMMKMLGLHSNQISLGRLVRLIKPEDRTIFLDGINESIESKQEYRMQHRYKLNDMQIGTFEILFRPSYKDKTGNTFYGTILDTTRESKENVSRIKHQEEQKNQIARELHENFGQKLNAASMFLGKASGCNDCCEVIEKATNILHEGIDDLGKLLANLSVKHIDDISLQYALEKLTAYLPEGMHLTFECNIDESGIDRFVKQQIFRVIQETVNNAIKYSEAKNLKIILSHDGSIISMIVEDNGKGFEIQNDKHGNGLMNITHRVKQANGLINIDSDKGKGTKVLVKMPVS